MSTFSKLLGIAFSIGIISLIFYVLFGQITVRKLRKKPETKDNLGSEFASGLDILNVAQALSLPKNLNKIVEKSPLSFLHAKSEILYKHTNGFDRFLARVSYWSFLLSALSMIILTALNSLGFVND